MSNNELVEKIKAICIAPTCDDLKKIRDIYTSIEKEIATRQDQIDYLRT